MIGNKENFDYFLKKGVPLKEPSAVSNMTLLHGAAYGGNINLIKFLINEGWDEDAIDDFGGTVLHHAVWGNSSDSLRYFIDRGHERNVKDRKGQTPLDFAKEKGYREIIEILENYEPSFYKRLLPSCAVDLID